MNILIADRQRKVRNALSILLSQHPGWFVIGSVKNLDDLHKQIDSHKPDILLIDWSLIDGQTTGLIQSLRRNDPDLVIIVLSGNPNMKVRALSMGANQFINKLDSPERMIAFLCSCENNILREDD